MAASTNISYKGATIATIAGSGTKTLNTQGKYCEGNITVQCTDTEVQTQTKSVTPSESAQTVTPDAGKLLSSVSVGAIPSSYVGSGVTRKTAQTYTPTTADQTIAADQFLAGAQTVKGDANLVAGNIKAGVTLFGVAGSYAGESAPTLPSAYQQVEYIEATGTQYIDTGLIPTGKNSAEIDFELTGYVATNYIALVSASTHMYLVHFAHSSGNSIYFTPCWYAYNTPAVYAALALNNRYRGMCVSANVAGGRAGGSAATIEGAYAACDSGTQTYTPTNTYYIFARNNGGGTVSYQAKAKLYGLTLYTNGVKQREFYPCYRKADGEIGLYDTVNDVFYTNIGTGTFGKGADVA